MSGAGTNDTSNLAPTGWSPVAKIARSKAVSQHEALEKRAAAARGNPEESANQYDVARKSILAGLSPSVAAPSQACLKDAKAARRKERLDLVSRAIVACPSCAQQAARLRQDMDEVEYMRCAKHVYTANEKSAPPDLRDNPPPGFLKPTNEQLLDMGLTQDMLQPRGTNFRAAVYVKDPAVWAPPDPPDPTYIVAFRGSTTELEDWENNMMQGANKTPGFLDDKDELNEPYHKRAVEMGALLGSNDVSVQFVGHSLGGGLASAAQGGSKTKRASTYNAAGLHKDTVGQYAKGCAADPSKINAIRIKGEVLTKSQEAGLTGLVAPDAVGVKRDLMPSHGIDYYREHEGRFDKAAAEKNKQKYDEESEYSTYLHGMDEVIDSMELQKKSDQKELEECLKAHQ